MWLNRPITSFPRKRESRFFLRGKYKKRDPSVRGEDASKSRNRYFAPSRSIRLRSSLRARRIAAARSRARFSDGFS